MTPVLYEFQLIAMVKLKWENRNTTIVPPKFVEYIKQNQNLAIKRTVQCLYAITIVLIVHGSFQKCPFLYFVMICFEEG